MTIRKAANSIVQKAVDQTIAEGREIGVQIAVYFKGELVIDVWGGLANQDTREPVNGDTLFNVFSVTKAIPATTVHLQAERGLVEYDAPIARYWPEWACNGKESVTVRDALSHSTGAPQMPAGVTLDSIGDWEFMVAGIAKLPLMYPIGNPAYHAATYGWVLGEIVRRTDPKNRPYQQFIQEELSRPLGIPDLWVGIPDDLETRIAKLVDHASVPLAPGTPLTKCVSAEVPLTAKIYENPKVRRACIAATNGIFSARSEARFWAMLANGGELDGVRLLSKERIDSACVPRANNAPDPIMYGTVMAISQGGYFLHDQQMPATFPATGPRTISYPGHGSSLGWADPDTGLAVAFCHNHMTNPQSGEGHPLFAIANLIRASLDLT